MVRYSEDTYPLSGGKNVYESFNSADRHHSTGTAKLNWNPPD